MKLDVDLSMFISELSFYYYGTEFSFQLRGIICQFHYLVIGKINWVKGLLQNIHKKKKKKKKEEEEQEQEEESMLIVIW